MRLVLWSLLILVVSVAVLKAAVVYIEPALAFFPEKGTQETPRSAGRHFETVHIPTADGETLQAWFMPVEHPRAQVIFWHGNGGNLSVWLPAYLDFADLNASLLAFDYRGYGESSGSPTEAGLYRDTDAVLQEFWSRRYEPGIPVIYWGRSIGTCFAAYATTVRRPDALVLETPFPDLNAVLAGAPILRALSVFSRYRFPAAEFLRDFDRPVLVVHGDRDRTIPLEVGRELYDGLRAPKTFATIAGADHNDLRVANRDQYRRAIGTFIDRVAPPR